MNSATPLMLDRPFNINIDIEPLDIHTKFELSNCSGVLDMQILVFTSYGRSHAHFC